ncbi:hypothetical protein PROFUN_12792 [Planoprotostelium fungivorum]|uniref:TOG domain-containing protein n=1 Tax=Planoprotostelium fungivorum TaxID=1890364 RepID=A0A2P6N6I5_9EUKA|nr:hypothetical protein PROFUN_12792 [Planoprotostelium fungivorum]
MSQSCLLYSVVSASRNNIPKQEDEFKAPNKENDIPEEVPASFRKDYEPLFAIFGDRNVLSMFSKSWSVNSNIPTVLKDVDPLDVFRGGLKLLDIGIADKNVSVCCAAMQLLLTLIREAAPSLSRSNLTSSVATHTDIIVDKMGETNPKLKDQSTQLLCFMMETSNLGPQFIVHHLLKQKKKQAPNPKSVQAKLELLLDQIQIWGLGDSDDTMPAEEIFQFVTTSLDNSSHDVRSTAVKLAAACYSQDRSISSHWTKMKPQLRELIEKELSHPLDIPQKSAAPAVVQEEKTKPGKPKRTDSSPSIAPKAGKAAAPPAAKAPLKKESAPTKDPPKAKAAGKKTVPSLHSSQDLSAVLANKQHQAPPPTSQKNIAVEDDEEFKVFEQDTCHFCMMHDPEFLSVESVYDDHLAKECPVLIECLCGQVIEISGFNEHKLMPDECQAYESFQQCPICTEAVPSDEYDLHAADGNCSPLPDPSTGRSRCPLCKVDLMNDEESWRSHLTRQCKMNPRRLPMKR